MNNYLEHFGLKRPVFKRDTQPYLFVSDQLRQAEKDVRSAFDDGSCLITVSGPIGSGKTTAVTHALSQLDGRTMIIRIGRVRLESDEVLELLLTELGVQEAPKGTIRKLGALGEKLVALKSADTRLVVLIEDAARTGEDTLAELEVLCSGDGGFDIGLVICGDETLPKLLSDNRLKRLSQRVSAQLSIDPLAVDEMEEYLLAAVRSAGGNPAQILGKDVPALLHILSCGIPRLANKLVDSTLKKAALSSKNRITCAMLADVAEQQFGITTEIPIQRRTAGTPGKDTAGPSSKPTDTATALDNDAGTEDAASLAASTRPAAARPAAAPAPAPENKSRHATADCAATAPESSNESAADKLPVEASPALDPEKSPVDGAPASTGPAPTTPAAPPVTERQVILPAAVPAAIAEDQSSVTDGNASLVVDAAAPSSEPPVLVSSGRHEVSDKPAAKQDELDEDAFNEFSKNTTDTTTERVLGNVPITEINDQVNKKDNEDLPHLIQDTQPDLLALDPDALVPEPSKTPTPDHEMLPDLDDLAAELAASDLASVPTPAPEPEPAAQLAVEIPDLPKEPDSGTAAADIKTSASDVAKKVVAEKQGPAKQQKPAVSSDTPEGHVTADQSMAGQEAPVEPAAPTTSGTPAPPVAKMPEAASDKANKTTAVSATASKSESTAASTETSSDEAALISALADEHNFAQLAEADSETPEKGFEDTTVTAFDTATATLDTAATESKPPLLSPESPTGDLASYSPSARPDTSDNADSAHEAESAQLTVPESDKMIVVEETTLDTDAQLTETAASADRDPSLELALLEDDGDQAKGDASAKEDAVVIHDADRDPTLAQLKPDLDALELALAENFVPDEKKKPASAGPIADSKSKAAAPTDSDGPVPAITLDDSIEEKVAAESEELAKRDAEIAARKKAAEDKEAGRARSGPSETDVHRLAAELQRANSLEEMDDRMAETLFGDEINMVASQVLKQARESAENSTPTETVNAPAATQADNADADIKKQFEDVWGEVPDESESIDLRSAKPNSGLDMSASQRLATVRALNAGMGSPPPPPPKARKKPPEPREEPVPIEDQIDISMTNTMKALNIDPSVLEQPAEEGDAPKGGFFSRFRKKG